MKLRAIIAAAVVLAGCQGGKEAQEVISTINTVNQHWQSEHELVTDGFPFHPYSNNSPFWHNAAYHTGNMEVARLADEFGLSGEAYDTQLKYSYDWAVAAHWMGATSTDPSEWRKFYGETPEHVLFGDWQICFQTYADLSRIYDDPAMIARAREVMEYEMSTDAVDYWHWADGIYMVMPVMTKLYMATGNSMYLRKMMQYWRYAKDLMYDNDEHLFYRDGKYVYPAHSTDSGIKDFWSRGNGWVLAALAKTQRDLAQIDATLTKTPEAISADAASGATALADHRSLVATAQKEFQRTFVEMSAALKASQQEGGYWTRSLLDAEQAPGYETSGTAFFCFGLFWGINNDVLPEEEYLGTAQASWSYLHDIALQEDGSIGYVQPIGERAIPGQVVDRESTANFGVGAFLHAACEYYRFLRN